MAITITKIFEFAAAHHLPHHKGKCLNIHGHSYRLEITITGSIQKEGRARGMIIDFGNFKKIVKNNILSELDHCNLNTLFDNPTAEIMVNAIAKQIQLHLGKSINVAKVRLWETSTSYATWEEDKC